VPATGYKSASFVLSKLVVKPVLPVQQKSTVPWLLGPMEEVVITRGAHYEPLVVLCVMLSIAGVV
jgi:hypothetical protein